MMLLDPKVKAEEEDLLAIAFGPDHRRNRKLIRSGPLNFNAANGHNLLHWKHLCFFPDRRRFTRPEIGHKSFGRLCVLQTVG
jgi:hypothetical protein